MHSPNSQDLRPSTLILVGLLLLIGTFSIWTSVVVGDTNGGIQIPSMVIGSFYVLSSLLVSLYKRIGLYIGVGLTLLALINLGMGIFAGAFDMGTVLSLVIYGVVAYFLYRYTMTDPDTQFFT